MMTRLLWILCGITVVLDHIDQTIPVNKKYDYTQDPDISELLEQSTTCSNYIKETFPRTQEILSRKECLKLRKETLEKIIDINFEEFTAEHATPYKDRLGDIEKSFNSLKDNRAYAEDAEIADLIDLLNDLKTKLYDKAHYIILQKTFPIVMSHPLISQTLHASAKQIKDVRKENTFASTYFYATTPFGKSEFQLQSSQGYYRSKKGKAAHSDIDGKKVNIKGLFELVNPDDPLPLEEYLRFLDINPIEAEYPEDENGNDIENLTSKRIKEYYKHIKFKDSYVFENINDEIPIDEYIYSLANSSSPEMHKCGSAETNFSTAEIEHRTLVQAFSEILRKRDSLTCLGNLVIERLENYMKSSDKHKHELHTSTTEKSKISIKQYGKNVLEKLIDDQKNIKFR